MSAWKALPPVLRGALAAAAIILAALGIWLWQSPGPPVDAPGQVAGAKSVTGTAGKDTTAEAPAAKPELAATEKIVAPPTKHTAADEAAAAPAKKGTADAEPTGDARQAAADAGTKPEAALVLPGFDVVRVEPDGSAVIAGSAAPADTVALLLDGEEIASSEADARGAFVMLTQIHPGTQPRFLTLLARGEAGERRSEASVIVAPVVVAAADDAEAEEAPAEAPASDLPGDAPDVATGAAPPPPKAAPGALETPETDQPPGTEQTASAADGTTPGASTGTKSAAAEVSAASAAGPGKTGGETAGAGAGASVASATKYAEAPTGEAVALSRPGKAEAAAAPTGTVIGSDQAAAETPRTAAAEPLARTTAKPAAAVPAAVPGTVPGTVPAAEPQLLVTSGNSLRVLQPSPSAAGVPLRVETIDYNQRGVTLSGRGSGGPSELRIYLDNAPVAEAPLATDGTWTAQLSGVTPGTYTLRVDQLGQNGKVTGRFETPFLRESAEALARAAPAARDREGLAVSVITVQPGYSLWAIATDRYGDGMSWHKVLEANRSQIRDPDLIYPGQVFDLPQ